MVKSNFMEKCQFPIFWRKKTSILRYFKYSKIVNIQVFLCVNVELTTTLIDIQLFATLFKSHINFVKAKILQLAFHSVRAHKGGLMFLVTSNHIKEKKHVICHLRKSLGISH